MPVETDADRRMFVNANDWAMPVVWIHAGGTAALAAIFDEDYALLGSPFVDAGMEGATPQIHCCSADVPPTGGSGDSVTVNGRRFTVAEIKPDGTGMTIVRLQEA